MSTLSFGSVRQRSARVAPLNPRIAVLLVAAGTSLVLGLATAVGPAVWIGALGAVLFVELSTVAVVRWRLVGTLLIVYLPYTGVLSLLLYPHTFYGEVARDALIVTPLYVGLFASGGNRRLPRAVVLPFLLLGALAVLQLLNPSLPSLAVGFVGLRGWLFFTPLLLVGARLATDIPSTLRLLRIALIAGIPVLVVGIVEALMLAVGKAGVLYGIYGSAAKDAFTTGNTGSRGAAVSLGSLHRVPSIFAYPAAYYVFCLAMLVPGYVLWRCGPTARTGNLGRFGFSLTTLAALTSGSREAFVVVPVIILLTLFLDSGLPRFRALVAGGLAFALVAVVMSLPVRALPHYFVGLSHQEGGDLVGHGFRLAHSLTWLGLGPGTDTNAARNIAGPAVFDPIGGRWQESYLVKSWIELGVPGLLLVLLMLGGVGSALIRSAPRGSAARPLIAASSALFLGVIATSVKGAILDQAPANAYVWLFAGLALGARGWTGRARTAGPVEPVPAPSGGLQ
jgi:hypothetical protein